MPARARAGWAASRAASCCVLAGLNGAQCQEPTFDSTTQEQHEAALELEGGGQSCRRKDSAPSYRHCRRGLTQHFESGSRFAVLVTGPVLSAESRLAPASLAVRVSPAANCTNLEFDLIGSPYATRLGCAAGHSQWYCCRLSRPLVNEAFSRGLLDRLLDPGIQIF